MLEEAKRQCDYLIVGLQTDPTIDRPEKNTPAPIPSQIFSPQFADSFMEDSFAPAPIQKIEPPRPSTPPPVASPSPVVASPAPVVAQPVSPPPPALVEVPELKEEPAEENPNTAARPSLLPTPAESESYLTESEP